MQRCPKQDLGGGEEGSRVNNNSSTRWGLAGFKFKVRCLFAAQSKLQQYDSSSFSTCHVYVRPLGVLNEFLEEEGSGDGSSALAPDVLQVCE
jgi:hypothetical protein